MHSPDFTGNRRSAELLPDELLATVRVGEWRFALALRHVERIVSSAMPTAIPAGGGALAVRIGDELLPVVFAAALVGADEVVLKLEDKMVVIATERGRAVLWVDAVEDIVPFVPLLEAPKDKPLEQGWVLAFSGGDRTLAVLDLPALQQAALAPAPPRS